MRGVLKRNLRDNQGAINNKLLTAVLAGVVLFAGILQYSKEKQRLGRELHQALREKERLNLQMGEVHKTSAALKEEVESLRKMFLNSGSPTGEATSPPRGARLSAEPREAAETAPDKPVRSSPPPEEKAVQKKTGRGLAVPQGEPSAIEKSLANIKNYKKGIEEQNSQLKEKIDQLNNLLAKKEEDISKLKKDNSSLKDELTRIGRAQEGLKEEMDSNLKDADRLKKQLSGKSDLENQLNELNNKLAALKDAGMFAEKQVLQYKQDKYQLETELDKKGREVERQLANNNALNKKIIELSDALGSKANERQVLSNELEELKESKRKIESQLKDLASAKVSGDSQITQLTSRLSDLNLSSESMKNTINQLSGLLSKKEAEISSNKNEASALKEDLNKAVQERDALSLTLDEKEKNISGLNAKLAQMEGQVNSLQTDLAVTRDSQNKTAEALAKMKSVNTSLHDKFLNITKALEPIEIETDPDKLLDKRKADDLRKKVEVELNLEQDSQDKKASDVEGEK